MKNLKNFLQFLLKDFLSYPTALNYGAKSCHLVSLVMALFLFLSQEHRVHLTPKYFKGGFLTLLGYN